MLPSVRRGRRGGAHRPVWPHCDGQSWWVCGWKVRSLLNMELQRLTTYSTFRIWNLFLVVGAVAEIWRLPSWVSWVSCLTLLFGICSWPHPHCRTEASGCWKWNAVMKQPFQTTSWNEVLFEFHSHAAEDRRWVNTVSVWYLRRLRFCLLKFGWFWQRRPAECQGSQEVWAVGPICHIIDEA